MSVFPFIFFRFAVDEDVSSRFECVFWLGDLNVRLERERAHLESVIASLRRPDVKMKETLDVDKDMTRSADSISYEDLLQHDELRRIKDQGNGENKSNDI